MTAIPRCTQRRRGSQRVPKYKFSHNMNTHTCSARPKTLTFLSRAEYEHTHLQCLPQNSNFFIFQLFQKIPSLERSAIYPLPKNVIYCLPGPTPSEEIGSEPQDSPSPRPHYLAPSALDNMISQITKRTISPTEIWTPLPSRGLKRSCMPNSPKNCRFSHQNSILFWLL